MTLIRSFVAGLLLVPIASLPSLAPAQQLHVPDEVLCPRVEQPPKLDGLMEDPCWRQAAEVTNFTRPLSEESPRKGITARLCFDGQAMYLAFNCPEPQPKQLKVHARDGSDDVWQDDCLEVWIRTGESQLDFDQFICNAAGARQAVRMRQGVSEKTWRAEWQAKTLIGKDRWTAEIAIPFAVLELPAPASGTLLQLKLGREDHPGGALELATWPPRSRYAGTEDYGRLYLGTANLLPNPDMSQKRNGRIADWGFGKEDQELFLSMTDRGQEVIRFTTPGRYSVAQQSLALKPDRVYRLDAEVRGTASVYLRARTSRKKGDPSTAYSVYSKPSTEYEKLELRFPTGETGSTLIIIGNTEGMGRGEVFIANLRVSQDVMYEADGPAIPLAPGKLITVTKVRVTDCRALRGFVAAPVDGRLNSYNWDMAVWEYNMRGAGAGVGYRYHNNDGLHITLADSEGVNAVQIRGGAKVRLYRDVQRYHDPGASPPVWEFKGRAKTSRALFPNLLKSKRFSFFDLRDGYLSDVSFLRFAQAQSGQQEAGTTVHITAPSAPGPLGEFFEKRFSENDRTTYALAAGNGRAIAVQPKRTMHLVTQPLENELSLGGIGLSLGLANAPSGCPLTVAVQDPLNPRQELMGADFSLEHAGTLRVVMDFPDQVVPSGSRLWLSLTFGAPVTVERAETTLLETSREEAVREALVFRKLTMKGLFCELSEARQWTTVRKNTDLEKFYKENHWGPGVKELAETIAQCKWLGPNDDTVRCYDEWFWRTSRTLPEFKPKIDAIPGAPEWAVLARQAWLAAREVPKWWLDHRLVPTGEFGGEVGDDTDMYQNYSDFVMFENDGVAAELKSAAANLSELAEAENLESGLNKRTMDSLHAYEEGVNHESLLLWWNYGDLVYFERCLLAAKSMPALTVVTEKGHRHFKSDDCGAEDLRINRPLGVDGGYHPLMLHPCLEVAWYNGNRKVVQFLREWGDAWVEHQKPGEYATAVDVKTEQATETSQRPLSGGGQASAHCFLYWLTDDLKYLRPFMDLYEKGEDRWPARNFVPELWHRGALDQLGQAERESVLRGNKISAGVALRDRQALCDALRADIAELQRFKTLYTDAEVFTDRVFLYAICSAARSYTGGFATRNEFNHTHAASWEGFGTDFAALVLQARRDHFKVLIYNFRDQPRTGRIRLWTLDHGRYRFTFGTDADGDDTADKILPQQSLEIGRATALPLTLPSRTVVVVELQQTGKLDDLRMRPDLAIAEREVQVKGDEITGLVHNIGGKDAPSFTLSLLDAQGKVRGKQKLGPLATPLDLDPKRVAFRFEKIGKDLRGWKIVVDAQGEIAEIFEENNVCELPAT